MEKTYKREAACLMLAFNGGAFIWGALGNAAAMGAAEAMMYPVIGFAAAAFGMDVLVKQFKR